jgi:hypothetical protein
MAAYYANIVQSLDRQKTEDFLNIRQDLINPHPENMKM